MCGIAGFAGQTLRGAAHEREHAHLLDRMCRIIKHRGPDDQGMMVRGAIALGMRRLSIIDLAGGHQPISNETGDVTVVFNGEIYNYRDLQRELEARGHQFQTHSDTETIVHAYEEYGPACVEHFRGMFALALWDEKKRSLFLARDRAGKKPLYYTLTKQGTLVFGSELKSLLQHPEVTREVNAVALDAYFTLGYVPDPLSIYQGIYKLAPGHYLCFADGAIKIKQYWDFSYDAEDVTRRAGATAENYLEELRALLDEAVRVRLVSDVPLGAFLSGGIDSSAVVGLMARNMSQPVKTFSIGFHEDSFNELKYARIAARHFGTEHQEFIVTPDICDIVDELAWHFDEPFADSSAIPTYMVSKLARAHVTVILSGDGGDELFAGYTRYVTDRRRGQFALLPRLVRQQLMQPISQRLPHGAWGRNYLYNVALDPLERYLDSVSVFTSLNKHSLYTVDFQAQLRAGDSSYPSFQDYAARIGSNHPLDALLYIDSKTYLPGDILTKVDRMSMAASLEARAPLLDHKLIEFVTRIPAGLKMKGSETKHIFKQAIADFVPPEILHRPKQGFGVPIQQWINQQLRGRIRETLTGARAQSRGLVEARYVNLLLDEHERNRRDHSTQLWALFMLELWQQTFQDAGAAPKDFESDAALSYVT
jgi:asparagine synthase (glutamine-hydrolysing)